MRNQHMIIAVALLLGIVTRAPAQPASPVESRWPAWLGCWQLVEERVREEWETDSPQQRLVPAPGAAVCVSPTNQPDAVRLTTTIASQSTLEDTIVADGRQHPLREPGCEGTQRTEWSANGLRLFARAELTCGGTTRTVSGMAMIDAARLWTDVQVVEESGRETIRVRRYRRAPDQEKASSGLPKPDVARSLGSMARHAATLTIDEVKEVARKLPLGALEAVLLETGASFPLNGRRLLELDDAGVPDRIIDLMVALSFPDRFVIERRASSGGGGGGFGPLDYGFLDGSMYDWPYYYAPFGYSTWGRYDTYYFGSGGYVVVDAAPVDPRPSGEGRVVDGLGYTRVRSREPVSVASSGGTATGGSGAGVHGGSSGSSGGTVSSGGYSGGGGDGGGRTAVSRPPGDR